jgi:hypothetical protein
MGVAQQQILNFLWVYFLSGHVDYIVFAPRSPRWAWWIPGLI